jgi:hypothetical protein
VGSPGNRPSQAAANRIMLHPSRTATPRRQDPAAMPRKRPTAADIGAYLDGTAGADDRRRIAQEILRDPDASARLRLYRQQVRELHRLYDGVLEEPIPDRLKHLLARGGHRGGGGPAGGG